MSEEKPRRIILTWKTHGPIGGGIKRFQNCLVKMLHELPVNHPDRNRSLAGCFYRCKNAKVWREIKGSFAIAPCSFNDLGSAWTDNDVFSWSTNE